MGTSLHTLVQMVDNGLGLTMLPEMAIRNGILNNTDIVARPLKSEHAYRSVALVWRKNSPREKEFRLLAQILRAPAQTVTKAAASKIYDEGTGYRFSERPFHHARIHRLAEIGRTHV